MIYCIESLGKSTKLATKKPLNVKVKEVEKQKEMQVREQTK